LFINGQNRQSVQQWRFFMSDKNDRRSDTPQLLK
jgi:hypothetical protein